MTDVALAPAFSVERARFLARELFGIEAAAAPLPSERDQNFLLTPDHPVFGKLRFVLKISNPEENRDCLDMQNAAMLRLAQAAPFLCPGVYANLRGETISAVEDEGRTYFVRLVSYLEGVPLAGVKPRTPALLHGLGRAVARLAKGLEGFDHPAAHRPFPWDLARGTEVVHLHKDLLEDAGRKALLERFADWFDETAAPRLGALKTSVVHGDANDYNVIVSPPDPDPGAFGRREVTGIVDFGDMIHSLALAEPAVACAYAMLGQDDPLAAAGAVIDGFRSESPLGEEEISLLYPLIVLRLLLSAVLCAHQTRLRPGDPYLAVSNAPVWGLLGKLAAVPPDFAHFSLRRACGLPPLPDRAHTLEWIRENRSAFAPVLGEPLGDLERVVFDLGLGSPLIENPEHAVDPVGLEAILGAEMKKRGARVGIGRYDESRIIYAVPQFKPAGRPLAEGRTVHLGIDLFVEPGHPVCAPLEGVVLSIRDNPGPFDYGPTVILEHRAGEGDGVFFTLYGHLRRDSVGGLVKGQAVRQGEQIAGVGPFPENGGWPPHLHFQIILDRLEMEGDFPGVCRMSERETWLAICPDPNLILNAPEAELAPPALPPERIIAIRREHLGKSLSLSYKKPLKIVRGFRQHLYEESGRMLLDGVNNVPHVGHSHPRVVEAARRQLAVLNTNTRYLHDNLARYIERLTKKLPDPLSVCFIVNSGSEANDLALRLARTFTRQQDMVVLDGAYHGHLTSLIEISPYKFAGAGGGGRPVHTQVVPVPDLYQGRYRRGDPEAGEKYAEMVGQALADVRKEGRGVAGFIAESLLSCGGQIVLPDGYLAGAYQQVRGAGGVCIADEVQVGFGRVGTHFWGFETQGVVPDIVTMGKPIGNGFPLAAVVTTREIADAFANGMEYFNTYGGNPVACAAGLAVLDVMESEKLQQNALDVGEHLKAGLERLKGRAPVIGDVRGLGLFIGLELVADRATQARGTPHAAYVAERMREEGILVSTDGPFKNVIKIKPPVCFSREDAEIFLDTLAGILEEDPLQWVNG